MSYSEDEYDALWFDISDTELNFILDLSVENIAGPSTITAQVPTLLPVESSKSSDYGLSDDECFGDASFLHDLDSSTVEIERAHVESATIFETSIFGLILTLVKHRPAACRCYTGRTLIANLTIGWRCVPLNSGLLHAILIQRPHSGVPAQSHLHAPARAPKPLSRLKRLRSPAPTESQACPSTQPPTDGKQRREASTTREGKRKRTTSSASISSRRALKQKQAEYDSLMSVFEELEDHKTCPMYVATLSFLTWTRPN